MPRRSLILVVVLALLVFVAGPSLVSFYTDWLWFGEVGYQFVYSTILTTQAVLFVGAFVVAAVWFVANLRLALATVRDLHPVFTTRDGATLLPRARHLA